MRLAPLGPTSIEATVRARRDSWPASWSSYLHPGAAELSASQAFAGALANAVVTVVVQVDKYYPHVAPRVSCTSFGLPVGSLAHAWVPGIGLGLEGGRAPAGVGGGGSAGTASSHHGLHAGAQQGHTGDRLGRVRSGSGTTFRGGEDGMGLPVSLGRTALELARLERKSSRGKIGGGTSAESATSAGSSVHQGDGGSGSRQSPGLRNRSGTAMSPSELSASTPAHAHVHAVRTIASAASFAHGAGSTQAEGAHTAEGWVSPGTLSGRWARSEGSVLDGPVRLSRPHAAPTVGLGLAAGGALSSPAAVSSANGAQAQDMDHAVEGATVGTAGSAGVSGSVSGSASEDEEDEAGVRHGVMGGGVGSGGGAGGRPFTRNSVGAPGTILEEEDGYAGLEEEDADDHNSSVLSGGGDEASVSSDSLADGDSEADANASVAAVGHVHHNGESTLKKHPSANSSSGGRRGGGAGGGGTRPDRMTDDMCVDLAHLDHRESSSPPAPVTAALRLHSSGMQARPWGHMADESSGGRGSSGSTGSHAGKGTGEGDHALPVGAVSGWRREGGRDRTEERAGGRGSFGAALARTAQDHAYGAMAAYTHVHDRGMVEAMGGLPQGLLMTGVAGDTGGQLGSASDQADGNAAVTSTSSSVGQEAGHISQVHLLPGHPVRLPLLEPSEWRPTMSLKDVLDAVRDVLTLHVCRGVLQGQGQAATGSIGSGAGVSMVPLTTQQQGGLSAQANTDGSAMEDEANL